MKSVFGNKVQRLEQDSICHGLSPNKGDVSDRTQDTVSPRQEQLQEMVLNLETDAQNILDTFEETASKMRYNMIEREKMTATVIRQSKSTGILSLLGCLNFIGHSSSINSVTAIKITIQAGNHQRHNICRVRALSGGFKEANVFFRDLAKSLEQFQDSEETLQGKATINNTELEQHSNPFYTENCARFLITKVLINQNTLAGKTLVNKIKQFLQNLEQSNSTKTDKKIRKSAMNRIRQTIDETAKIIQNDFRVSCESYATIAPYIKFSVQAYVFDQLSAHIDEIYAERARSFTERFLQKKKNILHTLSLEQIFEELTLTQKLTFISDQTVLRKIMSPDQIIESLGYKQICSQLFYLEEANPSNPRERLRHLMSMYSKLKSSIHQRSGRKYELENMEDIIPLTIIIVLICGGQNLRKDLLILQEFLDVDDSDCEAQKRLVVNMTESMNYVERDWHIDSKTY